MFGIKGWLVVLGFNATLTAKVISWRSVMHMCFLAFSLQYQHNFSIQSHRLPFSHASAEVKGENTPERKFASTGDRTHNHQVMNPTRSPGIKGFHVEQYKAIMTFKVSYVFVFLLFVS